MFQSTLSSLFGTGSSSGGLTLVVGVGLLVAFLVASKLVSVVVGMLNSLVQLAMTLGAVALIIAGIGVFAGLVALYNASNSSGY
jgi:hypothetical protein